MTLDAYLSAVREADLVDRTGRVTHSYGLVVESKGPDAFVGEVCEICPGTRSERVAAEVVGIKDGKVLLMPYSGLHGVRLGSEVIATGKPLQVPVGDALLGRVVDAFGAPLDGRPAPACPARYGFRGEPLNPLSRTSIRDVLETGVKAIDALLTTGKGQRVGIFSGSGVGKSTLLGMIARKVRADVNVIALVGERGREVREFVDRVLGAEGIARSVVVVATSDQPALVRSSAAYAATAIAEYFRDQGRNVALIMDSLTRFAMARREIGLAIGEPPTARGYTPSVYMCLSTLIERCGNSAGGGTITALYTALMEGDDLNDPIVDTMRSLLDGNIVLSRELANQGHYPAIDVLRSTSRLLPHIVDRETLKLVQQTVAALSTYEKSRELIEIGAYRAGNNPETDRAIRLLPELTKFLRQDMGDWIARDDALRALKATLGRGELPS
jgi:flagellum-specific ATP synthase